MPLTKFNCPDGITRPISECLVRCPRPQGRCLSLPYLYEVGYNRPFTKPSVTQCLNPTRMEYLKLTCDYAINPVDRAFALLGTRTHHRLDIVAQKIKEVLSEHKVEDDDTIGTLDLLEPDELSDGHWKLIDTKTWGSYQVAKQLGLKKDGETDIAKTRMQLNGYRIKVEPLGFPVSRMFIQAIIRDGGTFTAKNNKITDKVLMIPVEREPDRDVKFYFSCKAEFLLSALSTKTLPDLCDKDDTWNYRRCKGFCEVYEFCPEGRKINKLLPMEK